MKKFIIFIFMFITLTACNDSTNKKTTTLKETPATNKIATGDFTHKNNEVLVNKESFNFLTNGQEAFLLKKENKLLFIMNNKEMVLEPRIDSSKFWLESSGNFVYAFWWEKFLPEAQHDDITTGKTLFVRASQDGGKTFLPKKTINNSKGILPDIGITSDEKGNVAIIYLDERYNGYQIYINTSENGGKTWLEKDVRLNDASIKEEDITDKTSFNAVTPNIAYIGNELIATWQQLDRKKGEKPFLRFYSRTSLDFGKTWEKQALIYETSEFGGSAMDAYADKDHMYLVAGFAGKGVKLFVKHTDEAWHEVSGLAPNSEKSRHASYFRFGSNNKNLFLSYVFGGHEVDAKIWHTELIRYDKEKKSWIPGSFRLDATSLKAKSRGGYQDITTLDDGTVVAVWEDFRNIIPGIYMNYSLDNGDTWLSSAILLSGYDKPEQAIRPFIKKTSNNFRVFYYSNFYPEGVKPKTVTKFIDLPSPRASNFSVANFPKASYPDEKFLKKRLKERYESLMEARLKKDWEKAWTFLDPVYRNVYSKKSWLKTRDRIIYKKYSFKSTELMLPRGAVTGSVTYDLNPEYVKAEKGDPRFTDQQKSLAMGWGWFNDDWYQITEDIRRRHLP